MIAARRFVRPAAALLLVALAAAAIGLVNPQLQPSHLVSRYRAVIGGEVAEADADKGRVVLGVTHVPMGEFAPKTVTILAAEAPGGESPLFDDARPGDTVVAFVGKPRKGHEGDVLLYAGHQWHEAQMPNPADTAAWKWTAALGDEMVGTFNGAAEQLLALMLDTAEKRDYFPAYPLVKFKDDIVVGTFPGPIRGVALYDIDGDGRLDIYACHEAGNRAYVQTGPMKFEDRTARLGLEGVKGASCSFADASADGRADLLVDGVIYLQGEKGFAKSPLLPAEAAASVKCAAFVEINGDGYPDVVISRVKGGLAIYLNPGAKGGAFLDATSAAGLTRAECGAGETGFFAPGDWNGDGRTDLFFGVGKGLILVQDSKGVFSPVAGKVDFDFKSAGGEQGMTGAGCFAPLWRPDTWDLAVPGDMHMTVVTNRGGAPANVTRYANEVKVCRISQIATLAEDLDMDGTVDLFTLVRAPDVKNILHSNRGYGSFMLPELYMDYEGFPGKSFATGAWGAAAGDADGDGTNDLLLGGADGVLRLVPSDALAHRLRQSSEHPTPMEERLRQTRIISVRVAGKVGVLGADVRVTDAAGRVVRRHVIGSQVITGCRGPDTVNLAVRGLGTYTLAVRFSDGALRSEKVELKDAPRISVVVDRDARGR